MRAGSRPRAWMLSVAALCALAICGALGTSVASGHSSGPTGPADCGSYPSTRDPSNPLMLPHPPGANPLSGASFFVDGPRHGAAAGAIARLLGLDPDSFPDDYSWATFKQRIETGDLSAKLGIGRAHG